MRFRTALMVIIISLVLITLLCGTIKEKPAKKHGSTELSTQGV